MIVLIFLFKKVCGEAIIGQGDASGKYKLPVDCKAIRRGCPCFSPDKFNNDLQETNSVGSFLKTNFSNGDPML